MRLIVKSSSQPMHIGGSSPFNKKEWVRNERNIKLLNETQNFYEQLQRTEHNWWIISTFYPVCVLSQ